jgi:hypothetical protein
LRGARRIAAGALPEVAGVYWRPRADDRTLSRAGTLWTAYTVAHVVPFVAVAALMMALQPLAFPVAAVALAHAWIIPELYAQRGGNVVRPRRRGGDEPERVALGLLGDLVGHEARELHAATGLVLERGALGVWLVAEAGALLVRPAGHGRRSRWSGRVHCYCVRVPDPDLPAGDRTAHLLLALRADEQGFATVANLAFAGAAWRVRRRIAAGMRPALERAVSVAREA